jgi:tetratricopeptide (TPR) repeat protein
MNLGILAAQGENNRPKGLALWQQSLALMREYGNERDLGRALNNMGTILDMMGRTDEAKPYYAEALALRRRIGDWQGVIYVLNNLGLLAMDYERFDEAQAYIEEAVSILKKTRDDYSQHYLGASLGLILLEKGDYPRALELLSASLQVARKIEIWDRSITVLTWMSEVSARMGRMDDARAQLTQALETIIAHRQPTARLQDCARVVARHLLPGRPQDGAALITYTRKQLHPDDSQPSPLMLRHRREDWAIFEAQLTEAELAGARARGETMTDAEAEALIREALSHPAAVR